MPEIFLKPEQYVLKSNQIHIWLIDIEKEIAQLHEHQTLLNESELNEAFRFKFEKDKNISVISHACLRTILGRYLQKEPRALEFLLNEYGKPAIKSEHLNSASSLQFNLSHSGRFILLGISQDQPIGVDIEQMIEQDNFAELVCRYFSAHEHQQFQHLLPDQQLFGFYRAWTRKEAFLKAIGKGLYYSLKNFTVDFTQDEIVPIALHASDATIQHSDWYTYSFRPHAEYYASLCWPQKQQPELCFYEFGYLIK
jgi:4'-phosphopantetheinyl transferase